VGLERLDSGSIHLGGHAGLVFQSFELFPYLTTLDNCTLAQQLVAKRSRAESETRARRLLEELGLGHRMDAYPEMLSGGQRQRVAIARALAMEPAVLLYMKACSRTWPALCWTARASTPPTTSFTCALGRSNSRPWKHTEKAEKAVNSDDSLQRCRNESFEAFIAGSR